MTLARMPCIVTEGGPKEHGVLCPLPASQQCGVLWFQAQVADIEGSMHDHRARCVPHLTHATDGHFVKPFAPPHHERSHPTITQGLRHHRGKCTIRAPDQRGSRSSWIRERAQDVEYGRHAKFLAYGCGMTQRGMMHRRETEPDADRRDTGCDLRRIELDHHTEFLEHIRGSRLAGCRSISMFDDDRTCGSRNKGSHRRDVDGAMTVAPRAHDVEHGSLDSDGIRVFQHDGHQGTYFFRRFTTRAQRDDECGDLAVAGSALQDLGECPTGLTGCERRAGRKRPQDLRPGHERNKSATVLQVAIALIGCVMTASARDHVASQAS